jgi:hypothetical protein
MSGLVSGIFDNARNAVGAGVDVIRGEVDVRLATLGDRIAPMLTATGIVIVTANLAALSVGATLFAVGLPLWAALWTVTLTVGVAGGAIYRAKHRATPIAVIEPPAAI